jgi:bisphosphoglycerate-independent phosphoglycerate mutase (AlkP superfamily)
MGYDSHRSGDLIIVLEPGYLPGNSIDTALHQGTSHGSGYSYDTHVPLLWYGAGIKKQEIYRPINITDIAATLIHILNLQRIGAMTGNPIVEILQN